MNSTSLFTCALAATCMAASLGAQQVGGGYEQLWRSNGYQPGMATGATLVSIPDIDGDGVPDVVAASPYADTMGLIDNGLITAYSGVTGAVIWNHEGRTDFEARGFAMALAGDWNGDGINDVVVGSPYYDPIPLVDAGLIKVLDALTGVDIFTIPGTVNFGYFGAALDGGVDFNGDGADEILVGAPGEDFAGPDSGRSYVYSSAGGGVVRSFDGLTPLDFAGFSVAWIHDHDGDGFRDFLVGAPDASPGGVFEAGQALMVSGRTATLMMNYDGIQADAHLGHDVVGGRDLDGDLIDDFGFSAPGASMPGMPRIGRAVLRSGATGIILREHLGQSADDALGWHLAMTEDLNGDGVADYAVSGRAIGDFGFVEIYDGKAGWRMHRLLGEAPGDEYGAAVASVGDLTGTGDPALAIGIPGRDSGGLFDAGQARILAFQPCIKSSSSTISDAAGGAVNFALDFPQSEAGQPYAFLGSGTGTGPNQLYGLAIPLTPDGLFGRFTGGSPPPAFINVYGVLNATGDAAVDLLTAPGSLTSLVGRTFWFAAVSYVPGANVRVSTVAVDLTVTP